MDIKWHKNINTKNVTVEAYDLDISGNPIESTKRSDTVLQKTWEWVPEWTVETTEPEW